MVFFLSFTASICRTSGVVRVAVSDISNPCWKGAFVVFYLWDTHVMSTGSIGCESANLSSSSILFFLLSFNKFVSSNNCKSARYLWRRPVRRESHTRAIRAQCACVLPTVPLMRASFPSAEYLNGVNVCVFVVVFN